MKIFITGVAGFIGFHTARKLLEKGHSIVGIDNLNHYYDISLKISRLTELGIKLPEGTNARVISKTQKIEFLAIGLEDKNWMKELENESFDVVIHLAAQAGVGYSLKNPDVYLESNIIGFLNILEFARKGVPKHFIFASSSSVYGLNEAVPFQENHHTDHPISLYAATKKSNEMMAHTYSHLFNIPATGLRFFTVYGPWGRPDMALFKFTNKILKNEPIQLYNNGDMHRDFTYVDDIVNGILGLIQKPPNGIKNYDHSNPQPDLSSAPFRILNIGRNQSENLKHYVDVLQKALGKKAIIEYAPKQLGDVHKTYASSENLIKITGYSPSVSIEKGIPLFVEWYKQYYKST